MEIVIAICAVAAGIAGGPKDCRFACIGLGDCMDHCAFGAITMQDGVAHIDEEKCTACGACVEACPRSVIELLPVSQNVRVPKTVPLELRTSPVWDEYNHRCIGCGRCKKECQYDAIVVENGYARILPDKCVRCGSCAAVCPCNCITIE